MRGRPTGLRADGCAGGGNLFGTPSIRFRPRLARKILEFPAGPRAARPIGSHSRASGNLVMGPTIIDLLSAAVETTGYPACAAGRSPIAAARLRGWQLG